MYFDLRKVYGVGLDMSGYLPGVQTQLAAQNYTAPAPVKETLNKREVAPSSGPGIQMCSQAPGDGGTRCAGMHQPWLDPTPVLNPNAGSPLPIAADVFRNQPAVRIVTTPTELISANPEGGGKLVPLAIAIYALKLLF